MSVDTAFRSTARIDPRIRLLITVVVTAASFAITDPIAAGGLVTLAAALLLVVGRWRVAGVSCLLAVGAALASTTLTQANASPFMLTLTMLVYLVQKLIVMSMMGAFLTAGMSIALAVSTLETLRAPVAVTVPFAVALRFLPTIRQDWTALGDSLRVRGLAPTWRSVLAHPIRTGEHLVVPILMRALRTSDDLACAGLVRGLDTRGPRTILHELVIRPSDAVLGAVAVAATGALLCIQFL